VQLALKIDVDTLRGTREGVPRLAQLLKRRGAGASFYFSLGPDHTGRALRRVLRPGFFAKVQRTSVLRHYGVRTLLYGTLLPGPDIGRGCAQVLRDTRDAGFEVGIHCWDHVRWQDNVQGRDAAWTEREMTLACERFEGIFGQKPRAWAAAGWQTNAHAARYQQSAAFDYASDTRGTHPFLPAWQGVAIGCVQLPTTLPTLDELIGTDGIEEANVAAHLLKITAARSSHVFTAHAELEGGKLLNAFESLVGGWQAQGYELVSLAALCRSLDSRSLRCHDVVYGEVPGRSGRVALQGKEIAR
jgi:peptidoglycan/xylan/chitin deacetylase (PgdA/CDA1 family)